jgi:outer membrane protease
MRNPGWKLAVMIISSALATVGRAETINARVVDGPNTNVVQPAAPVPMIPPAAMRVNDSRRVTCQLWGGLGTMAGDVTYDIGGTYSDATGPSHTRFPLSRLKWPVDVQSATVGGSLVAARFWELTGRWSGNLSSAAGKLEDSDWEDPYDPRLKTTFSLSDTDFSGMTYDVELRCWALNWVLDRQNDYSIGFGAGWLYQNFSWDAHNVDQWDLTDPGMDHIGVPGLAGNYKTDLSMPYLDIACQMRMPSLSFYGSLGYSPITQVSDQDDHKLRSILAKTKADGDAVKLTLQSRYDVNNYEFVLIRADLIAYDVSGTEHDTVYGGNDAGDSWSIDHNISSVQDNLTIAVGVKF